MAAAAGESLLGPDPYQGATTLGWHHLQTLATSKRELWTARGLWHPAAELLA